MNLTPRNLLTSLWSRPDPILAEAGIAGELLVAKVRIAVAFLLLLIPAIDSIFFAFYRKESFVGLGLTSAPLFLSLSIFFLISREYTPTWMHFITSAFDVSLVSGAL